MKAPISGSNEVDKVFDWFEGSASETLEVLIAEDDAVSRRVLEAILSSYGLRVIVAKDGAEARRILEKEDPPPLIILDVSMPGMDGLEVCRWLRSVPRLKHSYVIFLTTRNSTSDTIAGLQAGADDYMLKPYDRAELRARLQVGMRVLALQKELATGVCANCGASRNG